MRWIIASSLFFSACSFAPRAPTESADVDAPLASTDGDVPLDPDASDPPPPPDAPPAQVTCTTADAALHLCLEFEDASLATAVDGSGFGHDATLVNATTVTRDVPAGTNSRAIALASNTSILIDPSNDLDIQNVTIGAWVQRAGLPQPNQQFGIIDIGRRQAAVAIDSQGRAVCMIRDDSNVWFKSGGTTASGEWAFVACTFDNPELCTYVYRNGSSLADVSCGDTDGDPINTSGNSIGTAIGSLLDTSNNPSSRLPGAVDGVRVYSRVLTETEICQSAGLTGC